jgi:hypothetical protein
MTQQCKDCQSFKIVWDWSNGDVVCTNCGLVQLERFIDDCIPYKDVDQYEVIRPPLSKNMITFANEINIKVFGGNNDDAHELLQGVVDETNKPKTEIAVDIFNSRQTGITAKSFCETLAIKPKEFWKAMDKRGTSSNDRSYVMLKRLVYDCTLIQDSQEEKQVLRVANKFRETLLQEATVTQAFRLDRLLISLVIIAVCDVVRIKDVTKKVMCKHYNMSIGTLKKHEVVLQSVLERSKTKIYTPTNDMLHL